MTIASEDAIEALKRVRLFRDLHAETLRMIAEQTVMKDVRPGEVLAREGEIGHDLVLIVDGSVRVESRGKIISRPGPGDFFGEISLLDGKPRTATVTAETPSTLLTISRDGFWNLLDTVPGLQKRILLEVCAHLRERTEMLETNRPGLGRRFFTD